MNRPAPLRPPLFFRQRWRRAVDRALPWLVIVVFWGCTWAAWQYTLTQQQRNAQSHFDDEVQKLTAQIERRLVSSRQILLGVRGIFSASREVDRKEFDNYVNGLHLTESVSGIVTLGFTRYVPLAGREAFLKEMHGTDEGGLRIEPAGVRPAYGVVVYCVPLGRASVSIRGYDMYASPMRREALDEARDMNEARLTGKIQLRRDEGREAQPAFLMVLPVYRSSLPPGTLAGRRQQLQGWVYASFRAADLLQPIDSHYSRELAFRVFDGATPIDSLLLFASAAPAAGWPPLVAAGGAQDAASWGRRMLHRMEMAPLRAWRQVSAGGRTWSVEIQSRPELGGRDSRLWPDLIAGAGFFGSLLMGWMTGVLVSGRRRAVRLARELNRKWMASESQFRVFFEKNGAAMLLFNPYSGEIVRANEAAADFYGYPLAFMVGMEFAEIDILSLEEIQWMRQLVARGLCQRYNRAHRLASGEVRDVEICSTPLKVDKQVLILSVIHDVSDRRRAEIALSISEQRYRRQSQRLSDIIWGTNIGTWEWQVESGKTEVNARTLEIIGLPETVSGFDTVADWRGRMHPDDRERLDQEIVRCFRREVALCECEIRLRHEAGHWVWVMLCARVVDWSPEGMALNMVGMCSDITERRMQNEMLLRQVRERTAQLRAMSLELSQVEERERKSIAQDLHDGPSQLLAIAQLKLSEVRRPGADESTLLTLNDGGRRLEEAEGMIKEASLALRSLSMQLSPAVLRQMGLASALDWLAEEMLRSYDLMVEVHCEVACERVDGARLNHVFRAVRELLINVAKHAGTHEADVDVMEDEGTLLISVSDDGIGFDSSIPPAPSPDGGYGLFSVCERINLIGGEVQIDSRPGDGAVVVLVVPVLG